MSLDGASWWLRWYNVLMNKLRPVKRRYFQDKSSKARRKLPGEPSKGWKLEILTTVSEINI